MPKLNWKKLEIQRHHLRKDGWHCKDYHQSTRSAERIPSETVIDMHDAFSDAREDQKIGVILLTGKGPTKDGKYAFCSGGDSGFARQRLR